MDFTDLTLMIEKEHRQMALKSQMSKPLSKQVISTQPVVSAVKWKAVKWK